MRQSGKSEGMIGKAGLVAPIRSILVTGANGFVGASLLGILREGGYFARGVVRRAGIQDIGSCVVESIDGSTNWRQIIKGMDAVVHLAARVHMMEDHATEPMAEFRRVNVDGTLALARQAADAEVRRFIFISSIKVNGDGTAAATPYRPEDAPNPSDSYGISKLEAEIGLRRIAAETKMEVVIIRPVLVYGPGVKGNFLAMMCWLQKGIPLPLGAINNARSLVALENLVDLIVTCLHHPEAANKTFLVSDGEDISTSELLKRTASAMGRKARLIPVPERILQAGARFLGKPELIQRLCGSLQVDITKTRELLGWAPPVSVDRSLGETASHFLRNHQG